MHPCLSIDEVLRLLARILVASEAKGTAVALARCCKTFEEPVLDALWETQNRLTPLLKCFPRDIWEEKDGCFAFKSVPTKAEWTNSRTYARRMQKLSVDTSKDSITPDTLLVLQFRTVNDPWLPRLKSFECAEATEAFTPFIPLFLSPKTTRIDIRFAKGTPILAIGSMIKKFSPLCPDLESITLNDLPRDSAVTEAVSEMLLACNRDTLNSFCVDSPLTEEAREVVYRLPGLSTLWVVIQGPISLPAVALPNLTVIDVEYNDNLNWLRAFRGAKLGKLKTAAFHSKSEQVGDFLGALESAALAASARNALTTFLFYTSRSWNPNYSSLLWFNQLKEVMIQFSCEGGCSSRIDDDDIISLARAMPKLEILRLGTTPCATSTGVTVNGLIALARLCPRLSTLRLHFQAATFVEAATSAATLLDPSDSGLVQREDCALTNLEVGKTPIPAQSGLTVALVLLQIFPRILNIGYTNPEWRSVEGTIKNFRQVRAFVHHTGNAFNLRDSEPRSRNSSE